MSIPVPWSREGARPWTTRSLGTRLPASTNLPNLVNMADLLLAGLNPAQRAAVTSTSSVVQVLAPPGSGKTKTLTTRVAYLLAYHSYCPQNVICCTFTIKAAREMRERLRGLVGCELESNLVLGTFHSICRRYLVAYGQLIGIRKGFGIADTSDTLSTVKKICKRGGYNIEPKTARNRISSHKAKNKRVEDLPRSAKTPEHQEFRLVYEEYERALATSNLLDYDDLLLRCLDLLQKHPTCSANIEAVLIDEFQDTNVVQFELMKLFAWAKKRITIVGDPDQSIYGFRSAEIENLRRMKASYPDTLVINLEENYRSASAILRLAQDVIEQDSNRPDKKLVSTHCYGTLPVLRKLPNAHEEALWIITEIKRMLNMTGGMLQLSDIAVLIRSAYLSLLVEKSFTSAGIPYRMVGGMRFFDRAEIRLIVDYLRTINHPDNDPALLSIINVPSRKIGDATVASFIKLAEEESLPIWQVVLKVLSGKLKLDKRLSNPSEQDLYKLVSIINEARKKMTTTNPADVPGTLIEFLVQKLCLPAYLQKKYKDDFEDRIENVQEFHTHAKDVAAMSPNEQLPLVDGVEQQQNGGGQEALDQFLANIVLSAEVENSEKGDDKPRVTISTIHSAKGLEWPVVFVPAIYEGSIPHSRAEDADEERRLLYVAMTRAQALLTLTLPLRQTREQENTSLTPFLPKELHKRLAERGPVFSDEVVADIATILRRDMPSQEALTRGLQSLNKEESGEDNLWPTDGSHRITPEQMQSMLPVNGMSLQDALRRNNSSFHGASLPCSTSTWDDKYGTGTTMANTTAFSTSNISVSFITAKQELKSNPPPPTPAVTSSTSDFEPQRKKPKLEKTKSAQGSIASFFSKPQQTMTVIDDPANEVREHWQSVATHKPEPSLPPMSPSVKYETMIPLELSTHRLAPSSKNRAHSASMQVSITGLSKATTTTASFMRPRPALELTSPNKRRKYVFLSSSPPPEGTPDEENASGEATISSRGNSVQLERVENGNLSMVTNGSKPASAATSHEIPSTSFSLLKQQTSAVNGFGVKKTLGVKRAMAGWNSRKNR